jgi:AraC-like DNA-binding protein
MAHRIDVFDDFHLHGASAPEWHQRYAQVSRGVMHSRLTEFVGGQLHVFRKWMSERVVQQGGLPRNQVCFAVPMHSGDGEPVAQGRSLPMDALLVLRGGAEFTIQRPRNMELLAVTVDSDGFWSHLDAAKLAIPRRATQSSVLRTSIDAADDLRERVLALLAGTDPGPAAPALVLEALIRSLAAAAEVTPSIGHATAAYLLAETHRMVVEAAPDVPSVAEVCARLRVSRRTLQNSFHLLAGTTPLDFMRAIRLNAVRDSLRNSDHFDLSVGQAASDSGFDHLSHFAQRYGALFGELPSRTPRMERVRSSAMGTA